MKPKIVLRHGKLKRSDVGKALAHNSRKIPTPNADDTKPKPRRLDGGTNEKIAAEVKAALLEHEKTAGRRARSDAVVAVEIVMSMSPEFFQTEADKKRWISATREYLNYEHTDRLLCVDLHEDEATPHIHALVVPRVKGRLCAKEYTAKAELVRLRDSYHDFLTRKGIACERGEHKEKTEVTTLQDYYDAINYAKENGFSPNDVKELVQAAVEEKTVVRSMR